MPKPVIQASQGRVETRPTWEDTRLGINQNWELMTPNIVDNKNPRFIPHRVTTRLHLRVN